MGIKQASMNVSGFLAKRGQAIANTARGLEVEQLNLTALNDAATALEAARNNSHRLDAAQLALPAAPLVGGVAAAE